MQNEPCAISGANIACVGGGPASLFFAILAKSRVPSCSVTVFERHAENAPRGWGVTLHLEGFDAAEPVLAREVREHAFEWKNNEIHVQGRLPVIVPTPGFSIGRSKLIQLLTARARSLGVNLVFERSIAAPSELSDYGLIVAGDGLNSAIRDAERGAFGTSIQRGANQFTWLGTSRVFDAFTFPFVKTHAGWIWAYAYGFDASASTFIVESSAQTWRDLGLEQLEAAETLLRLEEIFAPWLQGHALSQQAGAASNAAWSEFSTISNQRWNARNVVLMGDAAHTTHFTIGSGTRLAIDDATSLATNLHAHADLEMALAAYSRERVAALKAFQAQARNSASWFEHLTRYIDRDPERFARLLYARHSALVHRMPPSVFLGLRSVARAVPGLGHLRRRLHGGIHKAAGAP